MHKLGVKHYRCADRMTLSCLLCLWLARQQYCDSLPVLNRTTVRTHYTMQQPSITNWEDTYNMLTANDLPVGNAQPLMQCQQHFAPATTLAGHDRNP